QRIPNPRVGSSNLSTPAIFKAPAEMLELFCICHFFKVTLRTGVSAKSTILIPIEAEILESF
ncbi:hypothetical protein AB6D13_21640, partial [Vibrio cyclitrophicus]